MPRPRKPVELLTVSGTFRADRHAGRQAAPKAAHPIGTPPFTLAPAEAAAWREFVGNAAPGVLTSGDRWAVELACRLMVGWQGEGFTNGHVRALLAILTQLGVSLDSRSRVAPVAPVAPSGSPWDRLAARVG